MSPKTTVAAIIEKDGKILLTKRNHPPFKDQWCLPGGHIETNETVLDAVKREVKEETNLAFDGTFVGYSEEIFPEFNWHAVALVFRGESRGKVKINEESSSHAWHFHDEIKNLDLAFNHKKILLNAKEEP